jgi:hypothetical protein
MRLDLKARAPRYLGSYGVNAAVFNLSDATTRDTDHVVMMRGLTRNVCVPAIWQINTLNKALVCEKFKESEDGGAPDSKLALPSIGEQICGGEVPVPPSDEGGKLTAWPGQADPRLIKRFEQLLCHTGIVSELRPGLISVARPYVQGCFASTGMIHA